MKQELRAGNDLDLSRELEEGIRDAILDGKQSILFLNRRGNSRYLVCMDCGDVPQCPRCSVHPDVPLLRPPSDVPLLRLYHARTCAL